MTPHRVIAAQWWRVTASAEVLPSRCTTLREIEPTVFYCHADCRNDMLGQVEKKAWLRAETEKTKANRRQSTASRLQTCISSMRMYIIHFDFGYVEYYSFSAPQIVHCIRACSFLCREQQTTFYLADPNQTIMRVDSQSPPSCFHDLRPMPPHWPIQVPYLSSPLSQGLVELPSRGPRGRWPPQSLVGMHPHL